MDERTEPRTTQGSERLEGRIKVVFLNGPPRSGKDTIARMMVQEQRDREDVNFRQFVIERMATPLKSAGAAFLNTPLDELEDDKDGTHVLPDTTWRQFQIKLSEDFAKRHFGGHIFGELLLRRMITVTNGYKDHNREWLFIIADSGFYGESSFVADAVGRDNCLLVQITRPGSDFASDSRSFIKITGVHTYLIHNDGDATYLRRNVIMLIEAIAEQWPKPEPYGPPCEARFRLYDNGCIGVRLAEGEIVLVGPDVVHDKLRKWGYGGQ